MGIVLRIPSWQSPFLQKLQLQTWNLLRTEAKQPTTCLLPEMLEVRVRVFRGPRQRYAWVCGMWTPFMKHLGQHKLPSDVKQLKRNWRTWVRLRRWAIRDWIWLINRSIDLLVDWKIHSFVHVSICFIYLDRPGITHFLGHHEKGMHDHKLICLHESDLFCE